MNFTRLQKLVWMLRLHGNEPDQGSFDVAKLALHNPWTDEDAIRAEFKIQQNGGRKLPEEVAVNASATPVTEDEEE